MWERGGLNKQSMKDADIQFDGVGFNGPHLAKMTEEEFIAHEWHVFDGHGKTEKLKEVYALIQAKFGKKEPKPEAVKDSPATTVAKPDAKDSDGGKPKKGQ